MTSPTASLRAALKYTLASSGLASVRAPTTMDPTTDVPSDEPSPYAWPRADWGGLTLPFRDTPSIVSPFTVTVAARNRVS